MYVSVYDVCIRMTMDRHSVKRHTHTLLIRCYVYINNTVFVVYILVCVVAGYRMGGPPGGVGGVSGAGSIH